MANSFFLAKTALRKLMPGFIAGDSPNNRSIPLTAYTGSGMVVSRSGLGYGVIDSPDNALNGMSNVIDSIAAEYVLPLDRIARYDILEQMARSPTIAAALQIHISHALSTDKKSRAAFSIKAKDPNDAESVALCEELQADLGQMIDVDLPSWSMIMAIYGVCFLRPHAEHGKGITSIESSYFTLPHHIREFRRGGQLAGFAGDYITQPKSTKRVMADPWDFVPMRVPFWMPDHRLKPMQLGNKEYSLLTPRTESEVTETQNYGMSFLESAYEPWMRMNDALRALLANRNNSGKMDRLIGLATNELDPANAARYTREVTNGLKRSSDAIQRSAKQHKRTPTVVNHVIPIMAGGKGGVTIDTQTISADINGIEDIMFFVRQLGSSLGVDATMLGWADQMSGGLGEGGWIQTAIQAALRAEWIRKAATATIIRLCEVHYAYKRGKAFIPGNHPFVIEFHSLNTAIAEQEGRDRDSKVNFISLVVSVLDALQNNSKLAASPTTMRYLFGDILKVDQTTIDAMLAEFSAAPEEEKGGGKGFMESSPFGDLDVAGMNDEELLNLVKFALRPEEEK